MGLTEIVAQETRIVGEAKARSRALRECMRRIGTLPRDDAQWVSNMLLSMYGGQP